jgi:hypothetical protein
MIPTNAFFEKKSFEKQVKSRVGVPQKILMNFLWWHNSKHSDCQHNKMQDTILHFIYLTNAKNIFFQIQVTSRVGVLQKTTYEHLMVSQQPA